MRSLTKKSVPVPLLGAAVPVEVLLVVAGNKSVLGFWTTGVSALLLGLWARRPGSNTRATPARPHNARLAASLALPLLVHIVTMSSLVVLYLG